MENFTKYIQDNTTRLEVSHRGGGIEIDVSEYLGIEGAMLSAYQNYLGGGMLGSIQSDCNLKNPNEKTKAKIAKMAEELKRYFYELSNEEAEEYDDFGASRSYDEQQNREASAY